jgi:AcrR family transcriptional regulator
LTYGAFAATVLAMAVPTVKDRQEAAGPARGSLLTDRIAQLDPARPEEARLDALGLGLVDAVLAADEEALRMALESLRELRARTIGSDGANERLIGWLTAAIAFSYWGLERLSAEAVPSSIADGTHAWDFIQALRGSDQLGSAALRDLLEVDETEVSRSGRRLLEAGLVTRSKVGRQVFWRLTPRGRQALGRGPKSDRHAPKGGEKHPGGAGAEFWMAAIRQGFEGVAGDEPAQGRRTVDPTRERIVECTLELHTAQGVNETSFEQIAERAGVPRETVASYFPTRDDLVKGCGQHVLTRLRLPPPDRAGEIFAGAASERERVHRLIGTLFDIYERESESLARGRHDRAMVPLVDESFEQVDASVAALVAEALRPIDPNTETIASVRALTDLEVWRALREAGASPSASVEDASAAVERWLDSQRQRLGAGAT